MRLLLDTHVFLWMRREPRRLSDRAVALLKDAQNEVSVSPVTSWEIATKVRIGKLEFDRRYLEAFDARIAEDGFSPLHITAAHSVKAGLLMGEHKDPFDRLLVAIALTDNLTLVSADPMFKTLGIEPMW